MRLFRTDKSLFRAAGLRSTLARTLAGLSVVSAVVVAPTAAHATNSCATNCVYAINTAVSGTGATWFSSTNLPTTLDVTLYKEGVTGIVQQLHQGFAASHTVSTAQTLTPGTTYDWSAIYADIWGNKQWRMGSFTTKHRKVVVDIQSVTVTDKGNYWGSGSETFYARTGYAVTNPGPWRTDVPMTNGDSLDLGAWVYATDSPTWTPINLEMDDAHCGFCTYGLGADWGTGSDSQHSWITGWAWIDTTNATNGWQNFTITAKGVAGFTAWGYYLVEYV
jgi:hypothetical protein